MKTAKYSENVRTISEFLKAYVRFWNYSKNVRTNLELFQKRTYGFGIFRKRTYDSGIYIKD